MQSAEGLLISAVLRTGDTLTPMKEGVNPQLFVAYREEWEFIEQYVARHRKSPSKVLFRKTFPKFVIYKSDDVDHLCEEVKQEHARRTLIGLLRNHADDLADARDPLQIAKDYAMALTTLHNELKGRQEEMDLVADWQQAYKEVENRVERRMNYGSPGIPTGFQTLDDQTGGIHPGHYWVVAGRLGVGKTWVLIRLALQAMFQGYRVQYDALEQTRKDIAMRMHSFMSSHYGYRTFKSLDLGLGQGVDLIAYKKFLRDVGAKIPGQMFISDTVRGQVDVATIAAQIEKNSPDIVFIDYLTLMKKKDADWQGIAQLSGEIKALAQHYEVPIVCAAQINRMGINKSKEPPRVEYLAGSDAIGQDADAVVTIAKQSEHLIKFRMAKYRHGPDGYKWYAKFTPNTGHFEEVTGDEAMAIKEIDEATGS